MMNSPISRDDRFFESISRDLSCSSTPISTVFRSIDSLEGIREALNPSPLSIELELLSPENVMAANIPEVIAHPSPKKRLQTTAYAIDNEFSSQHVATQSTDSVKYLILFSKNPDFTFEQQASTGKISNKYGQKAIVMILISVVLVAVIFFVKLENSIDMNLTLKTSCQGDVNSISEICISAADSRLGGNLQTPMSVLWKSTKLHDLGYHALGTELNVPQDDMHIDDSKLWPSSSLHHLEYFQFDDQDCGTETNPESPVLWATSKLHSLGFHSMGENEIFAAELQAHEVPTEPSLWSTTHLKSLGYYNLALDMSTSMDFDRIKTGNTLA